jgi:hypothetical protein
MVHWHPPPLLRLMGGATSFSEHSVNIQWTFSEHSVNLQWTFSEHSVSIHWTFSAHSVNIQWTFSEQISEHCTRQRPCWLVYWPPPLCGVRRARPQTGCLLVKRIITQAYKRNLLIVLHNYPRSPTGWRHLPNGWTTTRWWAPLCVSTTWVLGRCKWALPSARARRGATRHAACAPASRGAPTQRTGRPNPEKGAQTLNKIIDNETVAK